MADPLRSEKHLHVVQVAGAGGGPDAPRRRARYSPATVTFDWVDLDSGEAKRGRITPADRVGFRKRLGQFDGEVEVVLEGCTGWRFIVQECAVAGAKVHVADPAEVAGPRSSKRRGKTDPIDACQLRQLLERGEVPESWIPPKGADESLRRLTLVATVAETERVGKAQGSWRRRQCRSRRPLERRRLTHHQPPTEHVVAFSQHGGQHGGSDHEEG